MRKRKLKRHIARNLLIGCILVFCLLIGIYVSIPDYPKNAYAWELMLWGEKSQWWSEITWILLFGVFSIGILYVREFTGQLKHPSIDRTLYYVRIAFLVGFLSLLWNFTALYWHWGGWTEMFVLDKNGYLHGVFYLSVALEGLYLFSELLGLGCKVHRLVMSRIGHLS